MNGWNKFDETELPAIDKFYSKLDLKIVVKKITNLLKMYGTLLLLEI